MFNRLMIRLETLYPSSTTLRRAKALAWTIIGITAGYLVAALLLATASGMKADQPLKLIALIAGGAGIPLLLLASFAFLLRGRLAIAARLLGFGLFSLTATAFLLPLGVTPAVVASVIILNLVLSALFLPRSELQTLIILYCAAIFITGFMQIAGVPALPSSERWDVIQGGISIIFAAVTAGFVLAALFEQFSLAAEKAENRATEMSNLVNALEQQTDRLAVINEISQMSADTMPFESLGQMIAEKLIPLLSPEHVSIGFLESNKQNASITTFFGPEMPARLPISKTPFSFALDENRTVRLNYRDHQRGTRFLYQVKGVKFMLIVPLAVRDQMFGTLNIGFAEPDMIIADDVVLCEQIGRQIAVMIENMQLYGRLENSLDEQSALYNTSLAINAASDLPTIYQMALKELVNISNGSRVDLYIAGPDPHNIISFISRAATWQDGQVSITNTQDRLDFLDNPFLSTFSSLRNNLVLNSQELEDRLDIEFRRHFLDSGVTNLMILPLSTGPIWLGFAVVQTFQEQHFSNIQIRLCRGIVDQVALAIDSQVLLEQARNSARREQVVNKLSYQLERANSMDEIIRIALTEVKQTLGAESVTLRLGSPNDTEASGGKNHG